MKKIDRIFILKEALAGIPGSFTIIDAEGRNLETTTDGLCYIMRYGGRLIVKKKLDDGVELSGVRFFPGGTEKILTKEELEQYGGEGDTYGDFREYL